MIYPEFLKKDDTVGICAPSSSIGEDGFDEFEVSLSHLRRQNWQIKETAKQIMTTSQNVSAELRSGDIEKICTVLDEYELQLEQACSVLPSNPIIETLSQISPQR